MILVELLKSPFSTTAQFLKFPINEKVSHKRGLIKTFIRVTKNIIKSFCYTVDV